MLHDTPLVPFSRAYASQVRSIPWISWAALLVSLTATVLGWHFANRQIAVQTQLRLGHEMDYSVGKLRERLLLCESVVHGAQGLYAASKSVERREWKVYGQGLFAEKQYPGVRALLSISFVPHTNLDHFLNVTRGDEAPEFAIVPSGTRPEYCPIKFIQSRSSAAHLLGKDVSLIPELFDGLMAARDSASFTLTSALRLTASEHEPPEVLLILPVYRNDAPRITVAERRAALEGWVAALLPVADLAAGVATSDGDSLSIFDETASSRLVYASGTKLSSASGPDATLVDELASVLTVGGRSWRVAIRSGAHAVSAAEQSFPMLVLVSGLLGGLFVFYLLWSLSTTRANAIGLAEEMTSTLRERERQLVEASRHAGMAEVATGVLHNVGNVLNSVNVSAALVVDQLRESKTVSLARVVRLLGEHREDLGAFLSTDPKGKQVPAFLEAVSEELTREQGLLCSETERLQKNIEHIKHIVSMQQSYAKVSGIIENLDPRELVENALHMSSTGLARHQVEVVRRFDDVPLVRADRHLALQILVNLINNAKEALDQRSEGRLLTLRIFSAGDGQVRFEVSDNGSGIQPENLTRIFQHGFTTKRSGHGFGLHSGANAAKEMGGSLSVRSDGAGTGATFCLELPSGIERTDISERPTAAMRKAA